jgi:hypothetical protein
VRGSEFQHHDGDEDGDDAVTKGVWPAFTHLFLNQIRMPIQITTSVAAEITEPIIRSITPALRMRAADSS